jgi:putative ABC transport system permease protein
MFIVDAPCTQTTAMFNNMNLRISWRYLVKDRLSTILNIVGLSTGLACALLIYIWVTDELQMDRFHAKGDRLYHLMENRIKSGGIWTSPTSSGPTAEAFKKDYPEVEHAVTIRDGEDAVMTVGEKDIRSEGIYASKDFFDMFTYPILEGSRVTDDNSILLSDNLAVKLFGSVREAIGKQVDMQHKTHYFVAGVFKAPDLRSSMQFDFVLSMEKLFKEEDWLRSYGNTGVRTYVALKPGTDEAAFNAKIAGFVKKISNGKTTHRTPFIARYTDEYLHGEYENGVVSGGRIEYVNLFSIIAIFILAIACINFMNLSTAKAARRAKEVGIKKVVGAGRGKLIVQFLSESLMITAFSTLLALGLVLLVLPAFNSITGKELHLDIDGRLALTIVAIAFFTGLVAGSYPALYLSGFKPGLILKGKIRTAGAEVLARKGLVVFQFAISVFLIISVMVVYRQIKYVQSKDLGFDKENVITFFKEGNLNSDQTAASFLAEVKKLPDVVSASSLGHNLQGHNGGTYGVKWPGRDPEDKTEFENLNANYGIIQTLGMTIKEGREFSPDYGADTMGILFNEAAIKYMGYKDPVGKQVELWGQQRHIVGVVKDFNFESLHKDIGPAFFILNPGSWRFMVRIREGKEKEAIAGIQKLYGQFNPGFAFDYKFLDERLQQLYVAEQRVSVLSRYFAGLAITISCLGLFGLTAFTAQRRQKEISIRKVIGATTGSIVLLLSKDFLRLVLIAVLVAFPVAWWAVDHWLKGFAYRIPVSPVIFVFAALAILLITIATISFQSLRAALSNPVKHLKNE